MKIRKDQCITLLLLLFFVSACIDPVEFSNPDAEIRYVISGQITDQPPPYYITVSRSAAFSPTAEIHVINDAQISITDDLGNTETLTQAHYLRPVINWQGETEWVETPRPGVYQTSPDGMQGQTGRSYTLHVRLPDGTEFCTQPQLMRPVASIDSIFSEYQTWIELKNGVEIPRDGFQVFINSDNDEGFSQYVKWKCRGIYEITTLCPDNSNCATLCWITQIIFNKVVRIAADPDATGFVEQPVVMVPNDRGTPYQIHVQQASLSRQSYEYWSLVQAQTTSVGSIFDPPPATITGNVFNPNDSTDFAFGFFDACSVTRDTLMIQRGEIEVPRYNPQIYSDCRLLPHSTDIRPEGF